MSHATPRNAKTSHNLPWYAFFRSLFGHSWNHERQTLKTRKKNKNSRSKIRNGRLKTVNASSGAARYNLRKYSRPATTENKIDEGGGCVAINFLVTCLLIERLCCEKKKCNGDVQTSKSAKAQI
jgi:hypothetical protein